MTTTSHSRAGLTLSVAFVLAVFAHAQTPGQDGQSSTQSLTLSDAQATESIDETSDSWFVELLSPPTADGSPLAQVRLDKDNFRAAARAARLQYSERYAYDSLWNGLSVRIARRDLAALTRLPGVKAVYPVATVTKAEDQPGEQTDLFTAITMTGADIAQNTLGYTGAGVRVAVIDTGIDYTHPDLGGCFGAGCRVEQGYDFVGDAFDNATNRTPVPDPDPMDCNGHGTHVSGIIGAKAAGPGGVTGVAPGVTFRAYRVFGCTGTTTADIVLAAMERVAADGADVLNMSLGSALQWPQSPEAAAASRLVQKNKIVVVASAGNDGTLGLYATSAPSVGERVISVASVDNIGVRQPLFTISPDNTAIGYSAADGAPAPPTSGTAPMARTGTATSTADACTALASGSLTGKVALIRRGTCSFNQKSINAQNAGAIGVVIYNNAPGFLNITVVGPPNVTIPVVSITAASGVLIDGRLASGPVTMTWTNQTATFPNPTGNLISPFSSYGVAPDLELKPDLSAPGGSVFSTFPVALGSYTSLSGTSMSSPHVAGAVALLLQARPHLPPQNVRTILQNSAQPRLWGGNPALGFLDNVHRQGAGILRIDLAIEATTSVEPGKLSLGESAGGPSVRTLTISNHGDADVTYDLSHDPALSTGANTFTPSFLTGFATVTFSAPSVTVPAGGEATVDVTITANAGLPDHSLYGGYLKVTPRGGGQVVRVPYAGFKGDYQSIQLFTLAGFPQLAKLVGGSLTLQPGGATFTLKDDDVPFILVHLNHQSRLVQFTVEDLQGKDWHTAFSADYVPRNSAANSLFVFTWDGVTTVGKGKKTFTVPNGQYRLTLSVLKALGDPDNPADVETWSSPVVTIARP